MIQFLTQKEWNELEDREKGVFAAKAGHINRFYYGDTDFRSYEIYPSIGEIWEVLENKIECIFAQSEKGTWVVDIKDRASLPKQFEDKEPIVALWKAYKFTLTL